MEVSNEEKIRIMKQKTPLELLIVMLILITIYNSCTVIKLQDSNNNSINTEGFRNTSSRQLDSKINSVLGEVHDLQVNIDSIESVIINKDSIN